MDDSEFIEWVAGHQRQLLRSAYLLTGDLHRAQDLVQEALVKVALRWSRLRTGNPTAYARRILVHDNVSWWRRHRRELTTAETAEAAQLRDGPGGSRSSYVVPSTASHRASAPCWCCGTSTT